MNIIGLTNVKNWITSTSSIPSSLLIIGDFGSGRHLVCNLLAEKLNVSSSNIQDLSKDISQERIDEIYLQLDRHLFIIDGSKISIINQQKLLKLIEEPPNNAYIVVLCESKNQVLETIRNRCYTIYMDRYSFEELKVFGNIDPTIANTPGKQLLWGKEDLNSINTICENIFKYLKTVNYPNFLSISGRFKYTDKDDGYAFELFIALLRKNCNTAFFNKLISFKVVEKTFSFINECSLPNINKKNLLERYLTDLRYDIN